MSIKILGVRIDDLKFNQLMNNFFELLVSTKQHQIATVNPEFLVTAWQDSIFKQILNNCTYNTADGTGVVLAARLKGAKICRITGIDLISYLIKDSRINNYRVYLLGAREGIAYEAKRKILAINSQANIVGCDHGFTNIEQMNILELNEIIGRINQLQPDLLLVGYNAPQAQKFIANYLDKLSSVKVAIGVGGSFDFLANPKLRAPYLIRFCGLEWFYRLVRQPRRYQRIYSALIKFSYLFIKYDYWAKN
ncbi:MAG: glycosyltransferase [Candidatus Komeilibacteria bacterium CG_4_10_14_0_2_um_filter_37_10]|uniref:Glycosyltransferase n=1 Tax=Candidatus Komeilibacteria bacterium CG_4_10_14_0_2_um_filter_37_10 TaxID=1974470 RepID=A0A2M7VDX3_9BACT|nr:MAG: glycosyltransferase [Candidatus Komeilibacteria bacterium CG_4_10_14_0_2_um_filter_37_10]